MEPDTQKSFDINSILPLYRLTSGCDYHRIILPLGYAGFDFSICSSMTIEKLKTFKAILFNRTPLNVSIQSLVKMREEYGTKIFLDLDDYWELYKDHYLYERWNANKTPEKIILLMEQADLITCTTERLASKIRLYNPNVKVIPNAMPFNLNDQFSFARQSSSNVRFGFLGGASHVSDVKLIAPVFQHFKHLDFTYCGYIEGNPQATKIRDVFSNNMSNPNYKSVVMSPLDKYMYGYDKLDCCVAPLINEEFNKYKSNLKILEAGLKKCAIICSPNECYTDTVPETMVTYCKSIKDWKEAIKKHQDLDYTKEKGEKLYDWVNSNYNLADINKQRLDLYETYITRS